MKTVIKTITVTELGDGFSVLELANEHDNNFVDYYVKHRDYGVINLAFGIRRNDLSREDAISVIEHEYIPIYKEEWMDE